jgi:hypothetical protein
LTPIFGKSEIEVEDGRLKMRGIPIRVLSIDMDFFIDTTRDNIHRWLDSGNEYAKPIMDQIWISRYASAKACGLDLKNIIQTNETLFKCVKDVVNKILKTKTPVGIADSHTQAFFFIDNLIKAARKKHPDSALEVTIYNLDMHEDLGDHNVELNCGNWISKLKSKYNENEVLVKHLWIQQELPIGDERKGEGNARAEGSISDIELKRMIEKEIPAEKFDGIYIAKSTAWTPPHSDEKFNELVVGLTSTNIITYDEFRELSVLRYNDIIEEIDKQAEFMRKLRDKK